MVSQTRSAGFPDCGVVRERAEQAIVAIEPPTVIGGCPCLAAIRDEPPEDQNASKVPIPEDVAGETLAVLNCNPQYFCGTGTSQAQSAVTNLAARSAGAFPGYVWQDHRLRSWLPAR